MAAIVSVGSGSGPGLLELLLLDRQRQLVAAVAEPLGQPLLLQPLADHRAALAAGLGLAAAPCRLDDPLRHGTEARWLIPSGPPREERELAAELQLRRVD